MTRSNTPARKRPILLPRQSVSSSSSNTVPTSTRQSSSSETPTSTTSTSTPNTTSSTSTETSSSQTSSTSSDTQTTTSSSTETSSISPTSTSSSTLSSASSSPSSDSSSASPTSTSTPPSSSSTPSPTPTPTSTSSSSVDTTSGLTTITTSVATTINGTPTTAPVTIVTALSSGDGSLPSSKRNAIIAGSAVGGIAFLVLLIGLFFFYRRRLDKKRYTFLKREPPSRAAFLADEVDEGYHDDPFATDHGPSYELPPRLLRARASESGSVFTEAVWPPPQNTLQDPIADSGDLGGIVDQVMGPVSNPATPLPPARGGTGTPRLRGGSGDDASLYSNDEDSLLPPIVHERPASTTSQTALLPDTSRRLMLTNPDAPADDASVIASPKGTQPTSPKNWLERSPRKRTSTFEPDR